MWNLKKSTMLSVLSAALSCGTTGAVASEPLQQLPRTRVEPLQPFQATCPPTAKMASDGQWSTGVIMQFERAEILMYHGKPSSLVCYYKHAAGYGGFLFGYTHVRNGYSCKIVGLYTFECK